MYELRFSIEFDRWLVSLRDVNARSRIVARLKIVAHGHFGDCSSVGQGVYELRIHYGPGYRLYYCRVGETVYFFLNGGDKSSQAGDISKAIEMADNIRGKRDGLRGF